MSDSDQEGFVGCSIHVGVAFICLGVGMLVGPAVGCIAFGVWLVGMAAAWCYVKAKG